MLQKLSSARHGAKKAKHHHAHHGLKASILKVSGDNVTVSLHGKHIHAKKTATFHTTQGTSITVNGAAGTVDNLAKGQKAAITYVGTTATKIVAADKTAARKHHHKKKKK